MRLMLACMVLTTTSLAVSVGDWSGEIQTDPMTDNRSIVMSTHNTIDLLGAFFLGTNLPEFFVIISEEEGIPVIGVSFDRYVGTGGSQSTCMVRIDDAPVEEYQVVIGNSNKKIGLYIGSDAETKLFFANLLRGSEILIRFRPAGQSQVTVSFSLSGIAGVSRELGIDVDQYLARTDFSNSSLGRGSRSAWMQGHQDYGVNWAGFAGNLNLSLVKPNGNTLALGTFSSRTGSAQIDVTTAMGVGSGYRLRAVDEFGNVATSSNFSIIAFNITSPSNRDVWSRGEITPTIQWTDISSPEVKLVLMRSNDRICEITNGWIPNQGIFSQRIEIPETWAGGNDYFVRVSVRNTNREVWEIDSERFTISFSDNERQGASNLSIDNTNTGMIDYPEDVDYWTIRCLPLHSYELSMQSNNIARMEIYLNTSLISTNAENSVRWDSDMGGTYYLKVTGLLGQEGSYTITPIEKQYPEAHRTISTSLGGTTLLSNGFNYAGIGIEAGLFYSPLRYSDIGVSFCLMQANEAMQAIIDPSDGEIFSVLELSAGLQSPELTDLSVRAGVSYNLVLSEPQYYWINPEYDDVSDAFVSGISPYFGLDWKVFSQRYGNALFVRLQRSFVSFKAGRMSLGLVFSSK